MLIVADTNTVLSGLLWGGPPRHLIDLARARSLTLCTSLMLVAELAEVMARDKFRTSISVSYQDIPIVAAAEALRRIEMQR